MKELVLSGGADTRPPAAAVHRQVGDPDGRSRSHLRTGRRQLLGNSSPGSGTVSIKAGRTAATIDVNVKADSIVQGNESLKVTLSSGVNASISRGNGNGTILKRR